MGPRIKNHAIGKDKVLMKQVFISPYNTTVTISTVPRNVIHTTDNM